MKSKLKAKPADTPLPATPQPTPEQRGQAALQEYLAAVADIEARHGVKIVATIVPMQEVPGAVRPMIQVQLV